MQTDTRILCTFIAEGTGSRVLRHCLKKQYHERIKEGLAVDCLGTVLLWEAA